MAPPFRSDGEPEPGIDTVQETFGGGPAKITFLVPDRWISGRDAWSDFCSHTSRQRIRKSSFFGWSD
jgi:hypothetical protein